MTGRPSTYSPEVGDQICELMAEGWSLRRICEREEMPARQTVMRWVESNTTFRDQFLLARVHMFDWIADDIIRIADDSTGDVFYDNDTGRAVADHARIQRDRLRVDSRKWLLSKQDAKRYGDRLAVEPENTGPIVIKWQSDPKPPAPAPEPPRQLTYVKPRLPGDLSEADWSTLLEILSTVKEAMNGAERPPGELLAVIKQAVLDHVQGESSSPAKKVTLPRRGRK
jgi:hypothetical protein